MRLNEDIKAVKKRYKYLAKQYHPDMVSNKDEKTIFKYTKLFQTIQQAYETVLTKEL